METRWEEEEVGTLFRKGTNFEGREQKAESKKGNKGEPLFLWIRRGGGNCDRGVGSVVSDEYVLKASLRS